MAIDSNEKMSSPNKDFSKVNFFSWQPLVLPSA